MPRTKPPKHEQAENSEVLPNRDLKKIAEEIKALDRNDFENAITKGKLLEEAKASGQFDHGEYEQWLKENFAFSYQTSLNYRNLYKLTQNPNGWVFDGGNITLGGLYLLASNHVTSETEEDHTVNADIMETVIAKAKEMPVNIEMVYDIMAMCRCIKCNKSRKANGGPLHRLSEEEEEDEYLCDECNRELIRQRTRESARKTSPQAKPLTPEVKAKIKELSKGKVTTAKEAFKRIRELQATSPGMTSQEAFNHFVEHAEHAAKPDKPQPSIQQTLERATAGGPSGMQGVTDANAAEDARKHILGLQSKAMNAAADYCNGVQHWLLTKPDIDEENLRESLVDNAQAMADSLARLAMQLRKDDDETDAVQAAADRAEAKGRQVH
jgi:Protein of unknown function (DUF3102)